MTSKAAFYLSRTIEITLLVLGAVIFFLDGVPSYLTLTAWDLLAVLYLAIRVRRVRRSRRNGGTDWLSRSLGGRTGLLFTVFTSIVGITAGLNIAVSEGGEAKLYASLVGLPAVVFAWAILHFGYAERYAKEFYAADPADPPLSFPNTDKPTYVEFAYFSFTLGTTFSVSDVETRSSAVRAKILAHSILSFFYNTATVGIAVSVITG